MIEVLTPKEPFFVNEWTLNPEKICEELGVAEPMHDFHYSRNVLLGMDTLAVEWFKDNDSPQINRLIESLCASLDYADKKTLTGITDIVEWVLRAVFYASTKDNSMFDRIAELYPLINKVPNEDNLDILLAYQLIFGNTNQLESLITADIKESPFSIARQQIKLAKTVIEGDHTKYSEVLKRYRSKREEKLLNYDDCCRRDWLDFYSKTLSALIK